MVQVADAPVTRGMSEPEVRRLDLGKARDAAAAALLGEQLDPLRGSWLRRVSVVMARRVDGVDVETEFLWEIEELSDCG